MADMVTKQELANAKIDAKDLGDAINEKKTVTPRYGTPFKTVPLVIEELNTKANEVIAQGFYKGFATEALLLAAKPTVSEMRARADDTRKIWRWNRTSGEGAVPVTGTWADTGLSDKDLAAADATTKANAAEANAKNYADLSSEKFIGWGIDTKNGTFKPLTPYVSGTLSTSGAVVTNTSRSVSDFTAINPSALLSVDSANSALLINVVLYDINKVFVSYTLQATWGLNKPLTIPNNVRFARFTVLKESVDTFVVDIASRSDAAITDLRNQALLDATTKANAAEANAKKFSLDTAQVFNASEVNQNYALTLDAAIALVPTGLRKRGLIVEYNGTEKRQFINDKIANWSSLKLWLRPLNLLKDGRANLFDSSMVYDGFTVPNIANSVTTTTNAVGGVAIIPIHRFYNGDGTEKNLLITCSPQLLGGGMSTLFLNELGENITTFVTSATGFNNVAIPANAKYAVINLSTEALKDTARKYLAYPIGGAKALLSKSPNIDGASSVRYGINGLSIEYAPKETFAVSPYFKSNLDSVGNVHVAQVVKSVVIQKGQKSLINNLTGVYRRFYIGTIIRKATTVVASINYETEDGVLNALPQKTFSINSDGFVLAEFITSLPNDTKDFVRVNLTIDPSGLDLDKNYVFDSNGEIHPSIVEKADRVPNVNKGLVITEFVDYGTSRTVSNMQLTAPEPIALKRELINGYPINTIVGDVSKKHQQTVLMGSKISRFYGKANLYGDVSANYPNNPKIKVLREPSSVDSNVSGTLVKQDLIGRNDSQYIHPDICYAPEGVAGYKYWMINSNFPNGYDPSEDADLFVSNDGQSWKRVSGFYEASNNGIAFKNPEVFWDTPNKNAFLPCPVKGVSLEFAKQGSTIETSTVTAFLNHDPAISYHNGYINVYILLGVGFNNASEKDYFYIICLRTNNGTDWEIVREDGSTVAYNQESALKIFSKTNGVRNHLRMLYGAGGAAGEKGFTPQVVKVSDNEWYYYDATKDTLTPPSGYSMNLLRYRGTSPYNFDFSNPEILSKNSNAGGNLWHFCMRCYDGIFYCVTNGYMFTSTDGINFTTNPYQFFWQGIGADLYKPSFVKGHDGKIKFAYATQTKYAIPHAFSPQLSQLYSYTKMHVGNAVMATLLCEYVSLADIMNRSTTAVTDAYADVLVMCISQRTRTTQVRVLYGIRDFTELAETLEVSYDDEIYVLAHLNTRNGGMLDFKGVAVTVPNVGTLA